MRWTIVSVLTLSACGGGSVAGQDAGSSLGVDSGQLPVYSLKVNVDLDGTAGTTAGQLTNSAPTDVSLSDVEDLLSMLPLTYDSSETQGGATAVAHVTITPVQYGFALAVNATSSSPGGIGTTAGGGLQVKSICATANGAQKFKLTVACSGTVDSTGNNLAAITVTEGTETWCSRELDSDPYQDSPWNPAQNSEEINVINGQACVSLGMSLAVTTGGGATGIASGSAQGTVTFTVEPEY